jgi:hypothetical protein
MVALLARSERSELRQQMTFLLSTSNCQCIIVLKPRRPLFVTESFDGLSQNVVLVAISGI